jgi:O-antigen ligase/tetratricopeptide (TPR) repeat protein
MNQPQPISSSSGELRPLDAVMLVLLVVTVAGGALLLSVPETTKLMEGAVAWHEQSILRAVVQLLCLNYAAPTFDAGIVKMYLLGVGAGLALLCVTIAILVRGREPHTVEQGGRANVEADRATSGGGVGAHLTIAQPGKAHIAPLAAAQILIGAYLLWSFASSRWSASPDLAVGASILLSIQFLWAFALGHGLRPAAALMATRVIIAITGITAVVAIWYYYGRNPGLRAMFPFGNPIFLATCLIPGLLMSGALIVEQAACLRKSGLSAGPLLMLCGGVVVLALSFWAFVLADSRSPAVGLVFGALAMGFFAVRGRGKVVPIVVGVILIVAGWWYFAGQADAFSPTGRSATIRLRHYAWSYAWEMFTDKPVTGHGQAGFVLHGDSYAANDVLEDPQVFESRIEHAHNEWLEVMSDLGAVGIVLLLAGLLITLRAGMLVVERNRAGPDGVALGSAMDSAYERATNVRSWPLIALMGALVGIMVTETFSVGFRVSGVPTFFFTVVGLIWALSGTGSRTLVDKLSLERGRRIAAGSIGAVLSLSVMAITQLDWSAARNEYEGSAALERARTDEEITHAIDLSVAAVTRLNPQRALTSLVRLGEAQLRAAGFYQHGAFDREQRAIESEPVNVRLLYLAREDYLLSDEHCKAGTQAIKELVSRSPGFISHGLLEYEINLVRARNAEAYGRIARFMPEHEADVPSVTPIDSREQFLRNAVAAIERELRRQPFNPLVATEYARIAPPEVPPAVVFRTLARPLRHHRIPPVYVDVMGALLNEQRTRESFEVLVREAQQALTFAFPLDESGRPIELWAPERLRLAGMVAFMQGRYETARDALSVAATGYDPMVDSAPMGAAACYAELADACFFHDPLSPEAAIEAAGEALSIAPKGLRGGELESNIRRRLVDYYLAAGQESVAVELLREARPRDAAESAINFELAGRYRRLCEMILTRGPIGFQDEALMGPPPPTWFEPDVVRALSGWIGRALELEPDGAPVQATAAAVALERGDTAAVVEHLRRALETGLPVEQAGSFLEAALLRFPGDAHLQGLLDELAGSDDERDAT